MEGHVYLTEEDLVRIAAYLGLSAQVFEERYIHRSLRTLRLRKPPKHTCMFLQDHRCAVHPVKPSHCRLFPFWPEIIESEEAWAETAKMCPGMGKGPLVQIEDAKRLAQEMHTAYPNMYGSTERKSAAS